MTRARGTDGSLLSSLPWTLSALVAAMLPHLLFFPLWVSGTFLACACWRLVAERRRRPLPSAWLRGFLALVCFLGILATYETISGVGPGSALLAIMAALKLLETRRPRDQFVLLFIAIFLVMSALLREQFVWSLPFLAAALLLIMTAWLRISGDATEPFRHSVLTAGRLLAWALPLALAMWVLFPRISSPFWAVPIDTSSGVTGLSSEMSPGDISSLSQSDEVAFRVRFYGDIPQPRDRYWRALVLHRFNGRTWSGRDPTIGRRPHEQIEFSGEPLRYQVTLEPTRQQWVPALEMPSQWDLPQTFMQPSQSLARVYPVDQRVAYEVESYTRFRAEPTISRMFRRWYLGLPEGSNPRTADLAREMRARAAGDREYIDAILRMFNRQPFFYTLEPPALGSTPVDRFLFDTRQGFCEHYASAFTVMMRAAGIPARVVLGYQGGEVNPVGQYMIVRQSDAHAWAEVWFEGSGWQRVDPTAAVAPERIDLGFTDSVLGGAGAAWGLGAPARWLHQLRLSWDALNAGWNEWILGYGPDRQRSLMHRFGIEDANWRDLLLWLIAIVIAMTLLVSAALLWRYRPPPPDRAAVAYRRFVRKTGLRPKTGESPASFAQRAAQHGNLPVETVRDITNSYHDARYGDVQEALPRLEKLVRAA